MARFRLVEVNDEGEVVREYYRSPMFSGDKWNKEFQDDHAKCLWDFSKQLHFIDYELCPQVEFHITEDDKEWNYMSDPVDDFYNL